MKTLLSLTKRNIKIFFKDKGLVISSLITPIILLVLYVTFLAKVYRDSFRSSLPEGMVVSDALVNGTVAAQLFASLIAVSCVTVAFCCNLLMVQDKANGPKKDFLVTPVSRATVAVSLLPRDLCVNAYSGASRNGRKLYLHCRSGLVYEFWRRYAAAFRRGDSDAVRHGVFVGGKRVSDDERAGFCRGHFGFVGIRFRLRRIYAYIQLRQRSAKSAQLASGDLRNLALQKSRSSRRCKRNGKSGVPAGSGGRHKEKFGLQRKLFRTRRLRRRNVRGDSALYRGAYRRVRSGNGETNEKQMKCQKNQYLCQYNNQQCQKRGENRAFFYKRSETATVSLLGYFSSSVISNKSFGEQSKIWHKVPIVSY